MHKGNFKTAHCPILGRDVNCDSTQWSRDDWEILQCRETGFVFLANPPSYSDLEAHFAWEKTSTAERLRRRKDEPVLNRLSSVSKQIRARLRPNRNRIRSLVHNHLRLSPAHVEIKMLDIGCGSGQQLLDMRSSMASAGRTVIPHGIEISQKLARAADLAVRKFGGMVTQASAVDGLRDLTEMQFDVVMMTSYLEHESQPLRVLAEVKRVLKPHGVCILKVPNFDSLNRWIRGRRWCGFRYPDHVSYFTPRTLRLLAESAGLTIRRQRFFDRFPLSDNMYAVLSR